HLPELAHPLPALLLLAEKPADRRRNPTKGRTADCPTSLAVSLCPELPRPAPLPTVSLHTSTAGTVVLHKSCRVEVGFFQARPRQRNLQGRYVHVDVGIVRLERFINAVCRFRNVQFAHYHAPVVIRLVLAPIRGGKCPRQWRRHGSFAAPEPISVLYPW